jgi:DNA-binding response OmpR family regulator
MPPIGIRRVLVVDDDHQIAQVMAAAVRMACDEVVVVGTMRECLSIVRTKLFALVLLDLVLPDSHAYATLECVPRIKAAGVPRVMCVTGTDVGDSLRAAATEAGAEGIITKDVGFIPNLARLFSSAQLA